MLKIERIGKTDAIKLSVKERKNFLNTRFRQALTYSLVFHLLLFCFFRIKFMLPQDEAPAFRPVSLAVDMREFMQMTVADLQAEEMRSFPYQTELLNSFESFFPSSQEQAPKTMCGSDLPYIKHLVTTQEMHPLFTERFYPLKIELSKGLQELRIVEDGSSLFRKKIEPAHLSHLLLTTSPLRIRYSIRVHGATGKIIECSRKHELLDKKLQQYADLLIHSISFAPFQELSLTGKLDLVFQCSGDELRSYLK
jgi:hypothetical protein